VFSDDVKLCSKCKQLLPLELFHRSSKSTDGLASKCKDCSKVVKDEAKEFENRLKKYSITSAQYYDMLYSHNECCHICGIKTELHIDHCHATGKVRGLLCRGCNTGLGSFKDDKENLDKAIQYLSL
jgi:hypothetical protein